MLAVPEVGPYTLNTVEPELESIYFQSFNLTCDLLVSNSFKFNLHRYTEVALGNSFVVVAQCTVALHAWPDAPVATAATATITAPRRTKMCLSAEHDVVQRAEAGDILRVLFVPGGEAVSVSIECFRLMIACTTGAYHGRRASDGVDGDANRPPEDWGSFVDPYIDEAVEEMTAAAAASAAASAAIANTPVFEAALAIFAEYLDEREE
jgi:hypothetical protein